MAIKSYKNSGTRDIAEGVESKTSLRSLPKKLHENARRKLGALFFATSLGDLAQFSGWRLEKLFGDRKGRHSLRINQQYRICFKWTGKDVEDVEIVDYH